MQTSYRIHYHNGNHIHDLPIEPATVLIDLATHHFRAAYDIDPHVDLHSQGITNELEEFSRYGNQFVYVYHLNSDGTINSRTVIDGIYDLSIEAYKEPISYNYSLIFKCYYNSYCQDTISPQTSSQ